MGGLPFPSLPPYFLPSFFNTWNPITIYISKESEEEAVETRAVGDDEGDGDQGKDEKPESIKEHFR